MKEQGYWLGICTATAMLIRTETARRVIGCAIEVHKALGPGLLESAYQACQARELRLQNLPFAEQVSVPIAYKGVDLDCGYRLDFIVGNELIVEVKAVAAIHPVHKAQALTYLKLTGLPQALLINFSVAVLRLGISSVVLRPAMKAPSALHASCEPNDPDDQW